MFYNGKSLKHLPVFIRKLYIYIQIYVKQIIAPVETPPNLSTSIFCGGATSQTKHKVERGR